MKETQSREFCSFQTWQEASRKRVINRKATYRRYLESPHWRALRKQAFTRDGYKCVDCGSSKDIQGHHVRYKKDFNLVPVEWIKTLCRICHDAFHKQRTAERRKKRKLRKSQNHIAMLICDYIPDS